MTTLAFLGTGLIGAGLARAAAQRGDTVLVWNRTASKAEALADAGVSVVSSPEEAVANAHRVHLALSDDAAVDFVLDQCLDALGEAVIVDHTTSAPARTALRAEQLSERGVGYLHAPVFMSPQNAREAKGIMLVAGPRPLYQRVAEGLAAMTGRVHYLGERSDLAAANKLFGNAMIISLVAGLSDVFSMARALDIEPAEAMGLFEKFNPALVLTYRGQNMSQGDYTASFELTMARKDVRLMLEAAADLPLSVLPAIAERMDRLIERGFGAHDLGVLSVDAIPDQG
jgi:3-hydroxyisobutyrate dehydrogenase